MGVRLRRVVRWKNEISGLTLLPTELGLQSQFMASLFATMVGLEVPASGGGTLELKPYAITEVAGARRGGDSIVNDATGDAGFDVKYGVTQNLVADLTVNTDFAQVEADEQQVNLTRFSLFFPEKREFFLENQGTFAFGGAQNSGARGGGTDTPVLFYSREIGLDRGREIPMDVGGRLTGRIGRFTVGFMNVQTGGVDEIGVRGTNFTVARVRRDILRRSNVGVLFTGRSVSKSGAGSSETYGVDGVFSFYDNLNVNTYWAKTATPDAASDDVSYKTGPQLQRRSIWRAGRAPRGRRRLQTRARVSPAGRLRPTVWTIPLQSETGAGRQHSKVDVSGTGRLCARPRRSSRNSREPGAVHGRIRERRHLRPDIHTELRTTEAAISHRPRRDDSCWRIQLWGHAAVV